MGVCERRRLDGRHVSSARLAVRVRAALRHRPGLPWPFGSVLAVGRIGRLGLLEDRALYSEVWLGRVLTRLP